MLDFIRGKLSYIFQDFGGWIAGYIIVLFILTIGIFLHRKMKNPSLRKGTLATIAALATILHTMIIAESYYRYVFDESDNVFQIPTTQRWVDRHVQINGFGFRDEHFFPVKAPEETRIGAFGDSFTWGQGIENREDLYDEVLERRLNESCPDNRWIKAYNFGKTGSDINDYRNFLHDYRGFDFDAVVVGYYLNDIDSGKMTRHASECYHRVFEFRKLPLFKHVFERSFALQYWWVRLYTRFAWSQDPDACWRRLNAGDYEDPEIWSRHLVTIDQLVNEARKQKSDLVVVIFPYLKFLNDPGPISHVAERIEQFLKSREVPVINLTPILSSYPPHQLVANSHDQHASELVHRIVADELYKLVKNRPAFSCTEEVVHSSSSDQQP